MKKYDEKAFSCPKCGKTFAQASNLKTHEKNHTVDKPFSFPKCGKTFAQASKLKTHEKINTGNISFSRPVWQDICSGKQFEDP